MVWTRTKAWAKEKCCGYREHDAEDGLVREEEKGMPTRGIIAMEQKHKKRFTV